ncbi:MAG: ABC transporter ATP-binding protein [Chloroflexales bacterium]|nr:ABC transporter ATP-binding protein [Chloroflexales bacterium]
MQDVVLQSHDLTKRYGDFVAVDNLNLTIHKGEVFGLLGPNGAGKTTTILMLLGLTEPSAGSVQVLGLDPTRQPLSVKAHVGYIPDQIGFYDSMTARENLAYIAQLNNIRRAEAAARITDALNQVGLHDVADQRVGTFSRGMRQRLGVAEVLIKRPQLIIMDEPTLALDPEAAREFLESIRRLKSEGITIMLSSHLLHQVQVVCDRIGLFHRGKMVLEGAVDELARRVMGGAYRIRIEAEANGTPLDTTLGKLSGVVQVHRPAASIYELEAEHDLRAAAAQAVIEAGGELLSLGMEMPNLDEIYTQYFKAEVQHAG